MGLFGCDQVCELTERLDLPIPPSKVQAEILAPEYSAVGGPIWAALKLFLARSFQHTFEGVWPPSNAHAAAKQRNDFVIF